MLSVILTVISVKLFSVSLSPLRLVFFIPLLKGFLVLVLFVVSLKTLPFDMLSVYVIATSEVENKVRYYILGMVAFVAIVVTLACLATFGLVTMGW